MDRYAWLAAIFVFFHAISAMAGDSSIYQAKSGGNIIIGQADDASISISSSTTTKEPTTKRRWFFQPRLYTGISQFSHDYTFTRVSTLREEQTPQEATYVNHIKATDILPFGGVGGTILYKRFYLDLYGQKLRNGDDNSTSPPVSTIKRYDYGATLGYGLTQNLSLFVGYKGGETELVDVDSSELGKLTNTRNFESVGPFIGAAYGFRLKQGLLGLNLAGAWLDTKYDVEQTIETEDGIETADQEPPPMGSNLGITLGISWKGFIKSVPNLLYTIGLDVYRYEMESDVRQSQNDTVNFEDSTKIEEGFYTLKASIIYNF